MLYVHYVDYIVYPGDDVPRKEVKSLESFLYDLKMHMLDKVIYAKGQNDFVVHSEELPPVIAPILRGPVVYNTEHEKESIYLKDIKFTGIYNSCLKSWSSKL